jgi:DNA-binding MarR family transcriptional regulator
MGKIVSDIPSGSDSEKNYQEFSVDQAYDILCEIRDTITRSLSARLSAAGFGDLIEVDLLTLTAMNVHRSAARALIRRLGITSQIASQSVEKLILHGYLDARDNPDKPRQASLITSERGHAAFEEIQDGLKADHDSRITDA